MSFRNRIVRISQLIADQLTVGTATNGTTIDPTNGLSVVNSFYKLLIEPNLFGAAGPGSNGPRIVLDPGLLTTDPAGLVANENDQVILKTCDDHTGIGGAGQVSLTLDHGAKNVTVAGGPLLPAGGLTGANGQNLTKWAWGIVAVTATAAAGATAAIAPGFTPAVIVASAVGTQAWYANAGSISAAPTVLLVKRDGVAATATVNVAWVALA